jgi:DNA repair protein RadC
VVSDQLPANSTAKAAQIKAALELGFSMEKASIEQERIQSPEQATRLILYEMSA